MADSSDRWARAVEAFTGYPMPSRTGIFDGMESTEPEGNVPLMKIVIEDRDFMEMTEDAYDLYSGPNTDGHGFVLHFYLPGDEDPNEVSGLDDYSKEELKEKIYPKLRKVLIDFIGPGGENVDLGFSTPFSWSDSGSGSLSGMEHKLGQYVEGSGAALYDTGYNNFITYNNEGFSSNGATITSDTAMDFSSFARTAEAYDRVAKFFTGHSETLQQWKESLGEDNAAWKGKAAEVFATMIDGLHKNYSGFADQMHPKDFAAQHPGQWDGFTATSVQGDAIMGAGNEVLKAVLDLENAHGDWMSGADVDRETLFEAGGDPIEYRPGLGSPYGILFSMLQSVQTWLYNNNARFAVEGEKTTSGSTYHSGNSTGAGSWQDTESVTHFYTLRPEAKTNIHGLGDLKDVTTWAGLASRAVDSWQAGVEEHLYPAANTALSNVNNAFIAAREVLEKVLEPEVTNYMGSGGSGGGGGDDQDEIDQIIEDINAEAEAAIAEANAAAEEAIAEANAAAEEAIAEAEAAIEESNAEAEAAIAEANAAAEEAIAEANAAAEEANANAETAIDEANSEAENAINEANNQVNEIRDETSLQLDEANSQANDMADQANADAEAAINEANNQVDEAIQEANNQSQTIIDEANEQLGNGNGNGPPLLPGLGNGFVTHQPPGNRTGGVTEQNPDGSFTTDFPDGSQQVIDPDGTVTETGRDGTVTVTRPDGSVTITDPDGNVQTSGPGGNLTGPGQVIVDGPSGEIITRPDGSTVVEGPSGEIITRPDGSTIVDGPGGRTETSSDGTVTVTGPDGSTKVTSPDGSITVTAPDGSSSVTNPDGSSRVELADGTVQETAPDGKITLTEPDGTTTVTYPDGSAKVTHPDGTVQEISSDGTVKETSPDGSVVVEGPGSNLDNPGDRIDNPGDRIDNPGNNSGKLPEVPRIDIDYPDARSERLDLDSPNGPADGSSLRDLGGNGSVGKGGSGDSWGQDDLPYDEHGSQSFGNGQGGSDNPFTQGDQGSPGSGGLGGSGSPGGSPMMPPMGGMQGGNNDSNGERERSNPGSRINRPAPRRGSTAAQAASRRAAAQREQEMHEDVVVARSTASGGGVMPPPAQRSEATQSGDRERSNWLAEDEDVWGTDEGTTPAVIGR
ncbi:AAWKG family protein [Streptomyces sp. NPDC049916]|uniref:AAWKG family protein n=1 Tax=Streptomyces sp. NPDC049916 TaxID=3155156 RepID=UPI003429B9B1